MEKIEQNMDRAFNCHVQWNGRSGFEISEGKDKHIVCVEKKSCSYRLMGHNWDPMSAYVMCNTQHAFKVRRPSFFLV